MYIHICMYMFLKHNKHIFQVKQFLCGVCGKGLTQKDSLMKHMMIHTGIIKIVFDEYNDGNIRKLRKMGYNGFILFCITKFQYSFHPSMLDIF